MIKFRRKNGWLRAGERRYGGERKEERERGREVGRQISQNFSQSLVNPWNKKKKKTEERNNPWDGKQTKNKELGSSQKAILRDNLKTQKVWGNILGNLVYINGHLYTHIHLLSTIQNSYCMCATVSQALDMWVGQQAQTVSSRNTQRSEVGRH